MWALCVHISEPEIKNALWYNFFMWILNTLERSYFSVCQHMRVQISNSSASVVALTAFVRHLPHVRPHLYLKTWCVYARVFHKWHFAKKKRCNTSTHPSRVYINQIWKNFFPKTSLEGLATWSKKATQGSLFVTKTYFLVGPDLCQVNF